jgi:branched-subunit amino acid transport protein
MTGWPAAALIAAVAVGVLLPKAVPAAVSGGHVGPRLERLLNLLPAALLGGLAVSEALGGGPGVRVRPAIAAAVLVAVVVAAVTRRSLLAMVAGWAVLAAGLLVG